jgi:hypothetical protein
MISLYVRLARFFAERSEGNSGKKRKERYMRKQS